MQCTSKTAQRRTRVRVGRATTSCWHQTGGLFCPRPCKAAAVHARFFLARIRRPHPVRDRATLAPHDPCLVLRCPQVETSTGGARATCDTHVLARHVRTQQQQARTYHDVPQLVGCGTRVAVAVHRRSGRRKVEQQHNVHLIGREMRESPCESVRGRWTVACMH